MSRIVRVTVWVVVLGFMAIGAYPVACGALGAIRGRWEAGREWKAGEATIYAYGLPRRGANVDAETGLPLKRIAGCVVTPDIEGRKQGHDAVIREAVARSGPPVYSWLVREPGVCGIEKMWDRRVKAGELSMRTDLDGRVHVRPGVEIRESETVYGSRQEKWMSFWIDGAECRMLGFSGAKETEAMLGEREKNVVYVRWKDETGRWQFGAVDVAGKRFLRVEWAGEMRSRGTL